MRASDLESCLLPLRLCMPFAEAILSQFAWHAELGSEPLSACWLVGLFLRPGHLRLLILKDGREQAGWSTTSAILARMASVTRAQLLVEECLSWRQAILLDIVQVEDRL